MTMKMRRCKGDGCGKMKPVESFYHHGSSDNLMCGVCALPDKYRVINSHSPQRRRYFEQRLRAMGIKWWKPNKEDGQS